MYESGSRKPVENFIKSLQPATKAKLARTVRLLKEFGPGMGMPIVRPLGEGLNELRVRGKQEVRIFYSISGSNVFLLHGFQKKAQKTPNREINLARIRLQSITRTNKSKLTSL